MATPSPGFLWGAGTAAYQVEGASELDGRGESIWDRFCATPGKVRNGESGAIACDFYHRYREDIALLRELGATSFRLSVAWPRILPEGRGRVNQAGLDFYDRVIDELLASEIEPLVTLYHWDLPAALEDAGGWPERSTVDAFCEYAEVVGRRSATASALWLTQNEPWVISWLGYGYGSHAPGRTSAADAIAAGHHVLLSHGLATEILRRESPGSRVGVTIDLEMAYPGHRRPGGRCGLPRVRRRAQPLVPRPALPRRLPGRRAGAARTERTAGSGRRHGGDRGADRLPRRQLLPAARRRPGGGRRLAVRARGRLRSTRTWAGRCRRTGSST